MKRSSLLVLSCAFALVIALFGLSACSGSSDSGDGSSAASSTDATSDAAGEVDPDDVSVDSYSADEMSAVFTQLIAGMSEYYTGQTPIGETLYYAGGADGENAIFVLIVPDTNASAIFIGPATVGDDNWLNITDDTTGSTIAFEVIDNGDGTFSFSMGEQYGAAVMTRCSSNDIVNALTEVVMATSQAQADAAAEAPTDAETE